MKKFQLRMLELNTDKGRRSNILYHNVCIHVLSLVQVGSIIHCTFDFHLHIHLHVHLGLDLGPALLRVPMHAKSHVLAAARGVCAL